MSGNPVENLPHITVNVWGSIYTSVFSSLEDMATEVVRPYPSQLLSLVPLEERSAQNRVWHKIHTALSYFLQRQSTYGITLRP
jgi:hypothetical protein